jgi:hypothetical protein
LPDYVDANYRQNFINLFSQTAGATLFDAATDLSTHDEENKIVVVSATSGFPLRFVDNIQVLKNKYEEKLLGTDSDLNKLVLHTETFQKPLPSLFIKSREENKKDVLPYVLLAYAMDDLVETQTNNTTGETFKAIGIPTAISGVNDWIDLGQNVLESVEILSGNPSYIKQITDLIDAKIDKEYQHITKKGQLKAKLSSLLTESILPLTGGNQTNDDFIKYRNITLNIISTYKL